MNYLNVPMQVKANDTGRFSGYASIASTVDRGGDIVQPFAFKEFERNDAGRVVVLWQHDTRSPIGTADVEQDEKGLRFDGSLVLADPTAQTAQAHMRAGSVRGMSIGYDVLDGGAEFRDGKRLLTALRLWELSLVTFPMHPEARVTAVKSRADLEHVAREVLGLSKSKARKLAYAGWPAISGEDDVGPDDPKPEEKRGFYESDRVRAGRAEAQQLYLDRGYPPQMAWELACASWPEIVVARELSEGDAAELDFFRHLTNTLKEFSI